MFNRLKRAFGLGRDDAGFLWHPDSEGLLFFVDPLTLRAVSEGGGNATQRLQLTVLRMLAEQGEADPIANGYRVGSDVIVALDVQTRDILRLPGLFKGSFVPEIRGSTHDSDFSIRLRARIPKGVFPFEVRGPLLCFSKRECFLQSQAERVALNALLIHSRLGERERTESENVLLVARLQVAKRMGMPIDLAHFDEIDVVDPEKVGVTLRRVADGSLELTPNLGADLEPDDLNRRWGQLTDRVNRGVLRVRNRIVVLDEERLEAVREVLTNRRIPREQVAQFLEAPSAYLDASKVDLDSGFSIRVEGVGPLEHIPIGELSASKRGWFDTGSRACAPEAFLEGVDSEEMLHSFGEACEKVWERGEGTVSWGGDTVDVSDAQRVAAAIDAARVRIDADLPAAAGAREREDKALTTTITLKLQDAVERRKELVKQAKGASLELPLNFEHLARKPFPHQVEGVSWLAGLISAAVQADPENPERLQGALLADDMGLGKTFMALVGLDYYYKLLVQRDQVLKPMLVVAPLTLLSNWEDEVSKTFQMSPFRDTVVLQANRDLKTYRLSGARNEGQQIADLANQDIATAQSKIRYALKIGKSHGTGRLDRDKRLVITTYQTLRDYQFSLCRIDWGIVVFDEAQNIKNPNVLQTRAAKALKADFKLLASGTPVENSLADFWCLLDTAQPGLFGSWPMFREEWLKPMDDPAFGEAEAKLEHGKKLRDAVGPFMLRRSKEDELPDLPRKMVYTGVPSISSPGREYRATLGSAMFGFQLQNYNSVLDAYQTSAARSDDLRGTALSALHNLRRISLHPRLAGDDVEVPASAKEAREALNESGRTRGLVAELDRIRGLPNHEGRKVIVFLIDKALQRQLKLWLDAVYGLDVFIVNGDTKSAAKRLGDQNLTRAGLIRQFEAADGFNVIIMSPLAAGTGLTVVEANHVVHLERHWNPAKEAQATDRVYRIGQKRNVHIYLPAVLHPDLDSFDVHLDRLLAGKMMLKDAVVVPESVTEDEVFGAIGLQSATGAGTVGPEREL